LDDSPEERKVIKIAQGEQTISERKVNNPLLTCVTLLCSKEEKRSKHSKRIFSQQRSILGFQALKRKRTKPLTLDLKRTTTKLKNFKRQTRKAQNKEAKPSWEKR